MSYYALRDGEGWLLFDAGLPGSVSRRIDEGSWQGPITQIVISHADADHLGDVAMLRQKYPGLRTGCHEADRLWVEDHDTLARERYDCCRERFGYGYSPELLDTLRNACGDDFRVDRVLAEGDVIKAAGQRWAVLHTPGHSPGHICLWCDQTGELLLGDAVLGRGPGGASGLPSMPPTHQYIESYLDTIDRLADLPVQLALPCHWTPMDGVAFKRFLQDAQEVVWRDLGLIKRSLASSREVAFEQLLATLNGQWSTWNESENAHYFYALSGYIEFLETEGFLRVEGGKVKSV